MIHLVRSVPRSHSGAQSSTILSIAEPIEKPIEKPIEPSGEKPTIETSVEVEVVRPMTDRNDESMTSRGLVVLEHLGAMYPVEMSQAIAPVTMSPTMKDLYQNLTVQQVAFTVPGTPASHHPKLPANTQFVQDYPSQLLQAPLIPVRARRILPPLPFLEVGSGLLAFTIVSGVVVVDGLKQAQNGPGPGKRTSPISSSVNDRTTRVAQANAGMSDMEVLKSGRTLPVPGLAMGSPTGLSMGGMNLTPAQMSQLAMQQAIAASKVGTPVTPPTSVIPTLNTFAPPQTGEALPAVPAVTPSSSSPTLSEGSAPQPILLSPPAFRPRSPMESAPERPPIVRQPARQSARQSDRSSARPSVTTQPLPVPKLPLSPVAETPIAPPSPPIAPSPSPSPALPIVRQSMAPEPDPIAPPVEERPRQSVPTQSSATPKQETQAAVVTTPQVLTSMRPETSDAIEPASLKPATSQDFVPKDLVFKQEIN